MAWQGLATVHTRLARVHGSLEDGSRVRRRIRFATRKPVAPGGRSKMERLDPVSSLKSTDLPRMSQWAARLQSDAATCIAKVHALITFVGRDQSRQLFE